MQCIHPTWLDGQKIEVVPNGVVIVNGWRGIRRVMRRIGMEFVILLRGIIRDLTLAGSDPMSGTPRILLTWYDARPAQHPFSRQGDCRDETPKPKRVHSSCAIRGTYHNVLVVIPTVCM